MTESSPSARSGTEEAVNHGAEEPGPAADGTAADSTTTDSTTTDSTTTDSTTTDGSGADETPTDGASASGGATSATGPDGTDRTDGTAAAHDDGDVDALADHEDKAYKSELRKGLLIGLGGGLLVGLVVSMVLGALIWPGYLLGPGSPNDVAAKATSALSTKDGNALNAVTCQGPDGPTSQIPPRALQLITQATQPGPPRQTLDTEARAPLDLVISEQGQTQQLPSDMVLGVNNGSWCLAGLAQRQQ